MKKGQKGLEKAQIRQSGRPLNDPGALDESSSAYEILKEVS